MGSIEYILINWVGLSENAIATLRGGATFGPVVEQLTGKVPGFIDSLLNLDNASVEFLGSAELSAKPTK